MTSSPSILTNTRFLYPQQNSLSGKSAPLISLMIFSVLTGPSIDKLEFKIEWKSHADGEYAFGAVRWKQTPPEGVLMMKTSCPAQILILPFYWIRDNAGTPCS